MVDSRRCFIPLPHYTACVFFHCLFLSSRERGCALKLFGLLCRLSRVLYLEVLIELHGPFIALKLCHANVCQIFLCR